MCETLTKGTWVDVYFLGFYIHMHISVLRSGGLVLTILLQFCHWCLHASNTYSLKCDVTSQCGCWW